MASLIKSVMLKIVADDADAQLKLNRISAEADKIARDNPEIKVRVESAAAFAKLMVLRKEFKNVADQAKQDAGKRGLIGRLLLGSGSENSGGMFGGGLLSAIGGNTKSGGIFGGIGGALSGSPMAMGIGGGLLATMMTGLQGIIPLAAAASLGIGAFGALAYPELSKMKLATHGLHAEWEHMAKALAPMTFKVFNQGLKDAGKLLPDLMPLAKAAAPAIDGLLKQLGKFADSRGFKKFLANMAKEAPGAIKTLGDGIGKVAGAIGKMILLFENPSMLRAVRGLFDFIAGTIRLSALAIHDWTKNWQSGTHDIAKGFDYVRHSGAIFGHDIKAMFEAVKAIFIQDGRDVSNWAGDVVRFGERVITWFGQLLPARIRGAVSSFPRLLFSAGQDLLRGLIGGIESMVSSVIGTVEHVGSSVLSGIKGALGIGSPSRITFQHGVWLAQGLAMGMDAGHSQVSSAAARMAGAALGGGGSAAGAQRIELVLSGDSEFMAALAKQIRIKGGDPRILQRKVVLV